MPDKPGSLLAQIEAGVIDDSVPLSSLLQKCIVLGGKARSEKMRDWARQELNGYVGAETVPAYRHLPAALMIVITNMAGYRPMTQRIDNSAFPEQIRDMIREKVDLEDVIMAGGIGELEAMASAGEATLRLIPGWSSFIADTLNQLNGAYNSHVAEVYWSVPTASIRGLLVRVRTALAELVAELSVLTPDDQNLPDKLAADQVVQFLITGDRNVITVSPQRASDGGTNVAVTGSSAAGPVTVSGAHGNAVGSQTVEAGNDAIVGGRDATSTTGDPHAARAG